MDPIIRELLDAADDPIHVDGDPTGDWPAMMASVASLKVELERICNHPFVLDDQVQDATFFAELSVQRPGTRSNWIDTIFAVRFSSFGRLFTTWDTCESERLPDDLVAELVAAVSGAGFRFVPASALDGSYTGRNPAFANSTWWIRFFDYV